MKIKHLSIFLLLALAGLLSACSGNRFAKTSWPGITVSGETVYVAFNTQVFALQSNNGTIRWKYPAEADRAISFFASPVMSDDEQLLVGGYDNILYSLNPASGQLNWSFEESGSPLIASPLANKHGIFLPSSDGNLYALDNSGNPLWEPFNTEHAQWAQPTANGDKLYLPALNHMLYAIDLANGKEVWGVDLGGAIVGAPTLSDDGILYVGTFSSDMQAINAETGKLVWSNPAKVNDWVWNGPALDGDTLYFGDMSGAFFAVNRSNGVTRWQIQADGAIIGTPLVLDGVIYFATEAGSVYAYSTEGTQTWTRAVGGKIYGGPVAAGDLIVVSMIEGDNLLSALDVNGNIQWNFTLEN